MQKRPAGLSYWGYSIAWICLCQVNYKSSYCYIYNLTVAALISTSLSQCLGDLAQKLREVGDDITWVERVKELLYILAQLLLLIQVKRTAHKLLAQVPPGS